MRRGLAALALLAGAAAIGLYLSHSPKPPVRSVPPVPSEAPASTPTAPGIQPEVSAGSNRLPAPPTAIPTVPSNSPPPSLAISPEPPSPPLELGDLDFRVSGKPDLPPETVLENTRSAIRDYGSMFGGNPVGTNPEITAALNGKNPKQAKFLRAESGMRINGSGELVDPWGTPLFFHQLSGAETEIHSAGPDKKMWTEDDIVIK
ncbi:MAG TPA: hypothetical protein VN794_13130 [Methylomirabilota bacterium]|nr:hypothetical protein [Methylomirabilota bacterium]